MSVAPVSLRSTATRYTPCAPHLTCVTLPPVAPNPPKVAVVGHVEWVTFARVPHIPTAGEIVHARGLLRGAGRWRSGGGRTASAPGRRGRAGDGARRRRARSPLGRASARVGRARSGRPKGPPPHARPSRSWTTDRERTITTFGARLEPTIDDADIPWERVGRNGRRVLHRRRRRRPARGARRAGAREQPARARTRSATAFHWTRSSERRRCFRAPRGEPCRAGRPARGVHRGCTRRHLSKARRRLG